jgi:hypothetical protein
MKQQIKFRGFRTDGKGWVEGFYVYRPDGKHLIYWKPFDEATQNTYHEIHPESLGMFTGQTDKNGREIFGAIGERGGDRVEFIFWMAGQGECIAYEVLANVVFKDSSFILEHSDRELMNPLLLFDFIDRIEIIGNQFETK